jgi:FdhD protein
MIKRTGRGGRITMKNIQGLEISRVFSAGSSERIHDEVIREHSYVLEVDGRVKDRVVLSAGHEKLWALGNLLCRGVISSVKDVDSIRIVEKNRIAVSMSTSGYDHFPVSECPDGVSGDMDPAVTIGRKTALPDFRIAVPSLLAAVGSLSEDPLFLRTGGVHVAALCSSAGEVLFRAADLGRHNVFDKVVGWSVAERIEREKCCIVISGRIPEDMVRKTAVSGIPLVASISAVTASAVEAALAAGITLIGFARKGRMNVYTHPERVLPYQE